MEGNLTKGPILKTLTKLAVPIMASSFLGTLYNITDMAWIGLLGSKAVAGVGVGGMFTWFSQGLASMSRMGGQVQVAQCIGRGDKEEAHKYAQTAVQLATLMGLLFAAVMLLFLHPLVGFFSATRSRGIAGSIILHKNSLWIDCVFIFDTHFNWNLYSTRRFKDAIYSQFYRTCNEYDLGSITDPGAWTSKQVWGKWSCDCNSKCTGNCYDYFDPWNYPTEKTKCIKRNQVIYKNSI